MGRPMSRNLLQAGHELTVYDVVPAGVAEVAAAGAKTAGSCREAASAADIIITMLPDGPEVEIAVLGKDGVLDGPWRQTSGGAVLEGTLTQGRRTGTWTETNRAGDVRQFTYPSGPSAAALSSGAP